MEIQDPELLKTFLDESEEALQGVEEILLKLESNSECADAESVHTMFRAMHSIKGGASFFGPKKLEELAHSLENVLDKVRKKEMSFSQKIFNVLLRGVDGMYGLLETKKLELGKTDKSVIEEHALNEPAKIAEKKKTENSIRVNLKTLDKLMNQAGELVLTRNSLLQSTGSGDLNAIELAAQRVNIITSELQEVIMSTRMQSVGQVFSKLNRCVRDLCQSLEKEVDLILEGEDVELDKTIVESIGDPLTHLVRNSLDHGIEKPENRILKGKSRRGKLKLSAIHKAGQVLIQIEDDGNGVNIERVKEKALEQNLVTSDALQNMSDKEILNFIFRPGFSTATEVTEVSGRGVGMDVVSSNLTKIGGTIEIDSTQGVGTTIRIKLPLTLAIIPSLLVLTEDERYAIPQVNLRELVRIPPAEILRMVKKVGDATVLCLRGELLPIIKLKDLLGIADGTYIDPHTGERKPDRRKNIADRRSNEKDNNEWKERRTGIDRRYRAQSAIHIAIVTVGEFSYGIIVDSLLDSAEIVVKPLGSHLRSCKIYAGATILGDGKVAPILDVFGIGQTLGFFDQVTSKNKIIDQVKNNKSKHDLYNLVIVENKEGEYFGIPVDIISRIEKIPTSRIENIGGKKTLNYRGNSILLLSIEDVVAASARTITPYSFIAIYRVAGHEVGLIVSSIFDIITDYFDIDTQNHRQPGVMGSFLVNNRITLLLDLFDLAKKALPHLFQNVQLQNQNNQYNVLLAEDSQFFQVQVKTILQNAGLNVFIADNGEDALEILGKHHIDILVTDIEMPKMNGFDLTRKIRSDAKLKHLPIIALTSLSSEADKQKGLGLGMSDYLLKMHSEQILAKCTHYLKNLSKDGSR